MKEGRVMFRLGIRIVNMQIRKPKTQQQRNIRKQKLIMRNLGTKQIVLRKIRKWKIDIKPKWNIGSIKWNIQERIIVEMLKETDNEELRVYSRIQESRLFLSVKS